MTLKGERHRRRQGHRDPSPPLRVRILQLSIGSRPVNITNTQKTNKSNGRNNRETFSRSAFSREDCRRITTTFRTNQELKKPVTTVTVFLRVREDSSLLMRHPTEDKDPTRVLYFRPNGRGQPTLLHSTIRLYNKEFRTPRFFLI